MTLVYLSDVITFKKGKKPKRLLEHAQTGALPYILIESFKGQPSAFTDDLSCPIVIPSDTLLVCDGARTGLSCSGLHGYIGSTLATLKPDEAKLEPSYLFYFMRSKYDLLNSRTRGAAIPHLDKDLLMGLKLPLPPIPEQRRIVDILSRAEGIVRLRKEAEKKAAGLVQGIFLEMFGDPATNPKGWPEYRLGDIAEVVSGVTKGRKFGDKKTVMVPYLRVANVQAGHIDISEVKTIEVLPKEVEQLALQYGDVVLTEGGDFDKLGRGALWEHDIGNCIHQNHIFRVRLAKATALPEFFVNYLQARKAREYFLRSAKRTTNLASINMTQLRDLPVVLPPLDSQREFVDQFSSVRSIQSLQSAATTKSQATFDALLGKVFHTGLP